MTRNGSSPRPRRAGLDLAAVTAQLEREGVSSFCDSYHQLLACIEHKLAADGRAAVTLARLTRWE